MIPLRFWALLMGFVLTWILIYELWAEVRDIKEIVHNLSKQTEQH